MADVSITIRVAGTPEVLAAFKGIQTAAQQTGHAASQASTSARVSANQATAAVRGFRQQAMALSSALAGAAAVASIFARNNATLQRQLEVLSLTMSGLSTSVRAVGAALRVVITIIGVKVAVLGAAVAAVVMLIRHWDQAKAAAVRIWGDIAAFFRRVFAAIGTAGRGLGEILLGALTFNLDRIRAGWGTLTSGLRELGSIAVDLGRSVMGLVQVGWDKLQRFFGQTAIAAGKAASGIKAVGASAKDLAETLDPGLLATLTWLGKAWEGVASEAERAAGRMGRSMAATAAAAREVLEVVAREEAERWKDFWLQLELNLDPALRKATEAFEKFLDPWQEMAREDPARSIAETTARLREQVDIARALVALEEERFRRGESTIEAVAAAKDALVAQIHAAVALAEAEGRRLDVLRLQLELLLLQSPAIQKIQDALDLLRERFGEFADNIREALRGVQDALELFFMDFLSGTQSLGEALMNLWRNIANAIIQQLARIAANWVFQQLLGGFGGLFGIPGLKLQRGGEMVVTRPTLMAVGEAGAERVTVQPVSGPMQRRVSEPARWESPTVLMPITINAVDAQSFLSLAQRSGRGLAEIMLGEMRKNSTLGKLLGGASVP